MKNLLHYISIVEARIEHPDVSHTDDPTKVTAKLSSYKSAEFTRLAKNMMRIDELTTELKQLQSDVKQARREDVAELFDVEDAVFTRVVETKSAYFKLTKDPKPTETPQYKTILEEFAQHLTPELIQVLEVLKKKHVTITQKEPALTYEPISEADNDGLLNKIRNWLPKFDSRLDQIEHQLA